MICPSRRISANAGYGGQGKKFYRPRGHQKTGTPRAFGERKSPSFVQKKKGCNFPKKKETRNVTAHVRRNEPVPRSKKKKKRTRRVVGRGRNEGEPCRRGKSGPGPTEKSALRKEPERPQARRVS